MHTKTGLCDPLRFISFNLCLVSFFKEIENIKTEIQYLVYSLCYTQIGS